MRVNAPIVLNALERHFERKRAKSGQNAPCQNKNATNAPGITVNAPPIIFGGKRPGAELASHLSVGGGAVSGAGKGALYTVKLMCG